MKIIFLLSGILSIAKLENKKKPHSMRLFSVDDISGIKYFNYQELYAFNLSGANNCHLSGLAGMKQSIRALFHH